MQINNILCRYDKPQILLGYIVEWFDSFEKSNTYKRSLYHLPILSVLQLPNHLYYNK